MYKDPLKSKRQIRMEALVASVVVPVADTALEFKSKDEIEAYALSEFGIDLDKRRSLPKLIKQVQELAVG